MISPCKDNRNYIYLFRCCHPFAKTFLSRLRHSAKTFFGLACYREKELVCKKDNWVAQD